MSTQYTWLPPGLSKVPTLNVIRPIKHICSYPLSRETVLLVIARPGAQDILRTGRSTLPILACVDTEPNAVHPCTGMVSRVLGHLGQEEQMLTMAHIPVRVGASWRELAQRVDDLTQSLAKRKGPR